MNRLCIFFLLLMFSVGPARALTYGWIDDAGVVHFTDSPETIPARYSRKVVIRDDITIRDPVIREEVKRDLDLERSKELMAKQKVIPEIEMTPLPLQTTPKAEVSSEATQKGPVWNLCAPGQPLTIACAPGPLRKKRAGPS